MKEYKQFWKRLGIFLLFFIIIVIFVRNYPEKSSTKEKSTYKSEEDNKTGKYIDPYDHIEPKKSTYIWGRKPIETKKFALIRLLSNDLEPRHSYTQTLNNLEFTIKYEHNFEETNKIWVLNKIADVRKRNEIKRILNSHKCYWAEIPPEKEIDIYDYRVLRSNPDGIHEIELHHSTGYNYGWYIDFLYSIKNVKHINNNGARNCGFEVGKDIGATWIMPMDGNCIFSNHQMITFQAGVDKTMMKYIEIPMERLLKNDPEILNSNSNFAFEESQIAFHRDATILYNEKCWYGRRPKLELLWTLNIIEPPIDYRYIPESREPYKKKLGVRLSSVYRLSSGHNQYETPGGRRDRCCSRRTSIVQYLDSITMMGFIIDLKGKSLTQCHFLNAIRPNYLDLRKSCIKYRKIVRILTNRLPKTMYKKEFTQFRNIRQPSPQLDVIYGSNPVDFENEMENSNLEDIIPNLVCDTDDFMDLQWYNRKYKSNSSKIIRVKDAILYWDRVIQDEFIASKIDLKRQNLLWKVSHMFVVMVESFLTTDGTIDDCMKAMELIDTMPSIIIIKDYLSDLENISFNPFKRTNRLSANLVKGYLENALNLDDLIKLETTGFFLIKSMSLREQQIIPAILELVRRVHFPSFFGALTRLQPYIDTTSYRQWQNIGKLISLYMQTANVFFKSRRNIPQFIYSPDRPDLNIIYDSQLLSLFIFLNQEQRCLKHLPRIMHRRIRDSEIPEKYRPIIRLLRQQIVHMSQLIGPQTSEYMTKLVRPKYIGDKDQELDDLISMNNGRSNIIENVTSILTDVLVKQANHHNGGNRNEWPSKILASQPGGPWEIIS